MTDSGGPRRGRHSSPDGSFRPGLDGDYEFPGYGVPRYEPSRYEVPPYETGRFDRVTPESGTGGLRRVSGVLDRVPDDTGPLVEPEWWSYGSSDDPNHPLAARHAGDRPGDSPWGSGRPGEDAFPQTHPSAPLPPRPPGVWDRLHPRQDVPGDDAATVAQPLVPAPALDKNSRVEQTAVPVGGSHAADDDSTDEHPVDPDAVDSRAWDDQTGGLEVIGAHVEEDAPRRRRRRGRRADADGYDDAGHDDRHDGAHRSGRHAADDSLVHDEAFGEDIPVKPYDPSRGRARRRRRPFAILVSLLVLAGLVFGIFLGGQKLLELIDPASRDYTGQGTGTVQVRVQDGDTLSDIARTLVEADVVASIGPFVDAAETNTAAVGIQPGVYDLRLQMSGKAALDLLLDPAARLLSRVTLPEGLTVTRTLARLAEETGRPVEEWTAAASDTAALGLPAYANGQLEGFLFPATYDIEPDDLPADTLRDMVARAVQALDQLQIPVERRLEVVTKASLVQAEAGSVEDMGKVARVLENRLDDGMALQLDTTVNYANNKGGITTTAQDRANPSPYNTYAHPGLPPGAINNPGEDALRAVLTPTPGDWRFFVVIDPDTGDTRFAVTGAEHQQNVLLFQQWLRANPEG